MQSQAHALAVYTEILRQNHEVVLKEQDSTLLVHITGRRILQPLVSKRIVEIPTDSLLQRHNCSSELLHLPFAENYTEAVVSLRTEELLEEHIKDTGIYRGRARWSFPDASNPLRPNFRYVNLNTSEDNAPVPYDLLLTAWAIRWGYRLLEEKGSHFVVVKRSVDAPELRHLTTLRECSCAKFQEYKDCLHIRVVNTIPYVRQILNKYQLIEST